jgi:hypothetical protein
VKQSPVFVAACAIAISATQYSCARDDSTSVLVESVRKALPGTTISLAIPLGWDDSDHSSCRQPCVRLRLPRRPDGGQPMWPDIAFERVAVAASLSPEQYLEALPNDALLSGPHRLRLGSYSAIEFTMAGEMVSHGPEDYARGTATRTALETRHFVLVVDRHLYHCSLGTYAGDLAKYSDVFRSFCASVAPISQ